MTKRTRIDSHELAIEYMKAAQEEVTPPPHLNLPDEAIPFWKDIVATRAPDNWTPNDLIQAGNLAMVYADILHYRSLIGMNGRLLDGDPDAAKPSAVHKILSDLTAQAQSLSRSLQVHARATQGESRDQAGRNNLFADARKANNVDDGLLAKPSKH